MAGEKRIDYALLQGKHLRQSHKMRGWVSWSCSAISIYFLVPGLWTPKHSNAPPLQLRHVRSQSAPAPTHLRSGSTLAPKVQSGLLLDFDIRLLDHMDFASSMFL